MAKVDSVRSAQVTYCKKHVSQFVLLHQGMKREEKCFGEPVVQYLE